MKKRKGTKLKEWQDRCLSNTEKCAKCEGTRHLTVDHIVPVQILAQFALDPEELLYNFEGNFQILCRYCNFEKAARLDPRNPKTYQILRAVIEKSEREALDYETEEKS